VAYAVFSAAASGHALDDRLVNLQSQNATLQRQIADEQREIAAAGSTAWLEDEARQLGYVKPGEHIYILTPSGQPLPSAGGVAFKAPPTFSGPSPGSTPTASPTATSPPGPLADAPPAPTPVVFSLPTPIGQH
jgi:hypothetical protein